MICTILPPCVWQTLLKNNASAHFLNTQLTGTEWRAKDVSSFLSKLSEDTRPTGTVFTWRDVFNETDRAVQTISHFMDVRLFYSFSLVFSNLFWRLWSKYDSDMKIVLKY